MAHIHRLGREEFHEKPGLKAGLGFGAALEAEIDPQP